MRSSDPPHDTIAESPTFLTETAAAAAAAAVKTTASAVLFVTPSIVMTLSTTRMRPPSGIFRPERQQAEN